MAPTKTTKTTDVEPESEEDESKPEVEPQTPEEIQDAVEANLGKDETKPGFHPFGSCTPLFYCPGHPVETEPKDEEAA